MFYGKLHLFENSDMLNGVNNPLASPVPYLHSLRRVTMTNMLAFASDKPPAVLRHWIVAQKINGPIYTAQSCQRFNGGERGRRRPVREG